MVVGARRRLDREEGKEEGRPLWPVGWPGPQVRLLLCEPTLEDTVQSPLPKCDFLVSPVKWGDVITGSLQEVSPVQQALGVCKCREL